MPLLLPFGFGAARQVTFTSLLNGAALFPFDLKREGLRNLADCFIHEGLTLLHWIPTGFRHFVGSLARGEVFPKLRLIVLAAEPLSVGDVELFRRHFPRDTRLVNYMGATETGSVRMYFIDHETRLPPGNDSAPSSPTPPRARLPRLHAQASIHWDDQGASPYRWRCLEASPPPDAQWAL